MSDNLKSSPINNQNPLRNVIIAFVAIALSITLALGIKTDAVSESLAAQAQQSTPIEVAINNHKPTLIEFYADWCTSCQAMAKDLATVKQEYQDAVNFVMLNVDNNKWLPEVLRYRVDGIPHFVFLDSQGKAIAQTIGEQPLSIMEANFEALIAGQNLPFAYATGQRSEFNTSALSTQGNEDNPRDHS
jgi:thiol-disulfide isomerase/thioredoxin